MKAIVLRELGEADQLRLEDVPDPRPLPDEVIVRLYAASINHRDVWIRRGRYSAIRLPAILGSDGAGEVISVGEDVNASLLGTSVVIDPSLDWGSDDRVQGGQHRILGMPDEGTYAEFVRVPERNVHPMPSHLSFEEAAALPLAGVTAYRAVVTRARVQEGETVLVTGIGGGVASVAFQIAHAIGARVLVTSGTDDKLNRARALGAEGGANYSEADWHKTIKTLCDGRGPDVVIDSVGGDTFAKAIEILRPGGRLVSYGATTGATQLEVRRIYFKQLDVLGSTMGTPKDFAAMLDFLALRRLRPRIDSVLPLRETAVGHRRIERGDQFGKIVLTTRD